MIKIVTVVGARPQFIKSAAISREISLNFSSQINEVIVHTGQHYDKSMSNVFFDELNIPKEKYNLQIGSSNHANQTAQIMISFDDVIEKENPNAVLLYGDTNSTLAACLVAVKRQIPIIHIEAGVRSYNKKFPEEVNRLICDHVSSLLFVPSYDGVKCLLREGFSTENTANNDILMNNPLVFHCGDIMYDNTLFFKNKADMHLEKLFTKYSLPKKDYFLITAHRPSNVDITENFKNILSFCHYAINILNKKIVFPIHPRTKKLLENNKELLRMTNIEGLYTIPPVSFIEMIGLQKFSDLIITDSGGVQKEAFIMEKPCLIMLEETPWVELVESKNAMIVGSNYELLCKGAEYYLNNTPKTFDSIYGNGQSCNFICQKIIENIL